MIRIIFIFLFAIISCKSTTGTKESSENMVKESGYKILPNQAKTFEIHFKKEESVSQPPKITYFVTQYGTSKIRRNKETILAEKIYWKSNNVIAIIPNREVIQAETEVGKSNNASEILITIN